MSRPGRRRAHLAPSHEEAFDSFCQQGQKGVISHPAMPALPVPATQSVRLSNGRALAFSVWGTEAPWLLSEVQGSSQAGADDAGSVADQPAAAAAAARPPPGRTVLSFHGFSSSRLEAGLMHRDALHYGLTFIAIDRPGTGRSCYDPAMVGALDAGTCPRGSKCPSQLSWSACCTCRRAWRAWRRMRGSCWTAWGWTV